MTKPRSIALLYALYAALAGVLLATTMPPLQNADEAAHAFRADQASRLGLMGDVLGDGEYGGNVSTGLVALDHRMAVLRDDATRKVTRDAYTPVDWGPLTPAGFPNTAVNPPFFYAPAAIAAAAASRMHVALPHALVLMRLATSVTTTAICCLAIALAGDAAIWFFAVLLLPMSLAVSTAVSQDGPMLACTALATALFLYISRPHPKYPPAVFVVMCVLLTMLGMARPPYLAFSLLAAGAPVGRSWRAVGVACIFVCVLAWSLSSAVHLPLPHRPDGIVSPARQLLSLGLHPWRVPLLAVRSVRANDGLIGRSFIGQLGWLDVSLPAFYYKLAWAGLALAAIAAWRPGPPAVCASSRALSALAIIGAVGGVGLVQYMTWTVVGAPVVEGIQGRYFLAPALLLGIFLARPPVSVPRFSRWVAAPVLMFPVVSIAVTLHAVILRYYL